MPNIRIFRPGIAYQSGSGYSIYHRSVAAQNGYGFFSNLFKTLSPVMKSIMRSPTTKHVLRRGLHHGSQFLGDLSQGMDAKTAAQQRLDSARSEIRDALRSKLRSKFGFGKKRNKPIVRKKMDLFL